MGYWVRSDSRKRTGGERVPEIAWIRYEVGGSAPLVGQNCVRTPPHELKCFFAFNLSAHHASSSLLWFDHSKIKSSCLLYTVIFCYACILIVAKVRFFLAMTFWKSWAPTFYSWVRLRTNSSIFMSIGFFKRQRHSVSSSSIFSSKNSAAASRISWMS